MFLAHTPKPFVCVCVLLGGRSVPHHAGNHGWRGAGAPRRPARTALAGAHPQKPPGPGARAGGAGGVAEPLLPALRREPGDPRPGEHDDRDEVTPRAPLRGMREGSARGGGGMFCSGNF